MLGIILFFISSLLLVSQPLSAKSIMEIDMWKEEYHQARISEPEKALTMLNNVYTSVPPSTERIFTASRIHGFMTRRGNQYVSPLLINTENDYEYIEQLFLKSMDSSDLGEHEKALNYIKKAQSYAVKLNDLELNSLLSLQQCRTNLPLGNYYVAEFYCLSAIKYLAHHNDHFIDIKWAYRLLALSYQGVSDYENALMANEKSLSFAKPYDVNDTVYNNIGILLLKMGRLISANEYANKALEIRIKRNIPSKIAQSYVLLAKINLKLSRHHKAEEYAHLAIDHLEKEATTNTRELSRAYLVMGSTLNAKGFYDDGIEYLLLALKLFDKESNSNLLIELYQSLSLVYLQYENPNKALDYISIAINKSEEAQSQQELASSYLIKSNIQEFIGLYAEALKTRKKYEEITQKIHLNNSQKAYEALQLRKTEIESAQAQLETLKESQQKQIEIDLAKRNRLFFQLIIILLVLTIAFTLRSRKKLNSLAYKDVLTNANNRHHMFELIEKNLTHYQEHSALVMLDVDNFKQLNDKYGHPNGDLGLKHLYQILESAMPFPHQIGRIGGEEFMVLLTNETKSACLDMIEHARHSLENSSFDTLDGKQLSITASFSWLYVERHMKDLEQIYFILDEGLYQAKQNGKNCIVNAMEDEIT